MLAPFSVRLSDEGDRTVIADFLTTAPGFTKPSRNRLNLCQFVLFSVDGAKPR
jgi:hypothetical protein